MPKDLSKRLLPGSQGYEMLESKNASVAVEEIDQPREEIREFYRPQSIVAPWQPQALNADRQMERVWHIYDMCLCLIPLALLAKTSLCIVAHTRDKNNTGIYIDQVSSLTLHLINFNDQLITAFTIVFVTIISTVTHRFALYKAQQGGYLIDIEQLHASISLPTTIAMVFSLRKFTKFSAILVVVWSFYYLGSQACKREYGYAISQSYTTMDAAYPTENTASFFDQYNETNGGGSDWLQGINAGYVSVTTSGGASNAKPGIDQKGLVLIPDIAQSISFQDALMSGAKFEAHHDGWITIKPSDTSYASAGGRPLLIRDEYLDSMTNQTAYLWSTRSVVGHYRLKTSFFSTHECAAGELLEFDAFPQGLIPEISVSINASTSNAVTTLDSWVRWNSTYGRGYLGDLWMGPDVGAMKVSCKVTSQHVELQVSCVESGCVVRKIRNVTENAADLYQTRFSDQAWANNFLDHMLMAGGPPNQDNDGAALYGLQADLQYSLLLFANGDDPSLSNADSTSFYLGDTLTSRINDYFNMGLDSTSTMRKAEPDADMDHIQFSGAFYVPQYRLYWWWIGIDFFSGVLLLVGAVFSFWLRRRTLAPDIFGFVSSLTRDNPHIPVPEGGSSLSGLDRARYLRHVKIKITDVRGHDGEIGKVGLTVVGTDDTVAKLSKHRRYL